MNNLTEEQIAQLNKVAKEIKEIAKGKSINLNIPFITMPNTYCVSENNKLSEESNFYIDSVYIRYNYTPPKTPKLSFLQRIKILFKGA